MRYPDEIKTHFAPCQPEIGLVGSAGIPRLIWVYILIIGLILLLFTTEEFSGISFSVFTQDPLVVAKGQPYFGLLSNLGILFWCAASSICFFTWAVLRPVEPTRDRGFLLFSGLLTLQLTLDDLYQLHEEIFPDILGIRQRYVLLGYLVVTAAYLVVYRLRIMHKSPLIMFMALMFFAISVTEDATSVVLQFAGSLSWHHLVEDGSKLLGIVSWFIYFVCIAQDEIRLCIDKKRE